MTRRNLWELLAPDRGTIKPLLLPVGLVLVKTLMCVLLGFLPEPRFDTENASALSGHSGLYLWSDLTTVIVSPIGLEARASTLSLTT